MAYVQELHEKHAEMNGEECDVQVYEKNGKIYWKAPHKVTGKMVHKQVPPSVYSHIVSRWPDDATLCQSCAEHAVIDMDGMLTCLCCGTWKLKDSL